MKYTIFDIADENFGIDIQGVVEILKPQKLFKIPELPDFVSGVISVRGEIIPVIDLRIRFGITEKAGKQRVVLIRLEENKVGLLVDNVTDIVEISEEKISKPPKLFKGFRAEFIKGLGQEHSYVGAKPSNNKVIIILDIKRILTSEEKIKLKTSREILKNEEVNPHGRESVKRSLKKDKK
ncbi:Positive regulator of CheA protein activity (CheW) [hydrothermal vent metagenome]|uniref:Positive regulator of CheA protein activity (CheW) n=1 Tax=hydrothermal vent metagenome TaxID=652676 RepID=A0A3B1DHH7_9ZZZZ